MEVISKRSLEPCKRKRSVSSSALVVMDSGSDKKLAMVKANPNCCKKCNIADEKIVKVLDHELQLIAAKKARFEDTILKAKQKMEECEKFKADCKIYSNMVVRSDVSDVTYEYEKQPITAKKALARKRRYEDTTMTASKKIEKCKQDRDLKVSKKLKAGCGNIKKKLKARKKEVCKRDDHGRPDDSRISPEAIGKHRESARKALLEMEKSVIGDNIDVMREFERLCGCSGNPYGTVFHIQNSLDWFLEPEEKEDDKKAADDQVHSDNKKMGRKRDDCCRRDDSRISREAIEKQRESARMAILQMEKSVDLNDNLESQRELERLCGSCAWSYERVCLGLPLKNLGLFLKPNCANGDDEEENEEVDSNEDSEEVEILL